MLKTILPAALGYSFLFIISSCTDEYIGTDRIVCYEQEIAPLILSSCTRSECHNPADLQAGYDFTTYEGLLQVVKPGDYASSKIYKKITDAFEVMPPDPFDRLSKENITTIALWIDQGAQKDIPCTQADCDTLDVRYSTTIKPILDVYCNGCHAGSQPQGDIDYNTYAGVKGTVDNQTLLGSIRRERGYVAMPKNGNKIPDCKIRQVEKWILEGAKNN